MRKEFYQNLFLPTSIVVIYWLLNLPSFFFPIDFFNSDLYQWTGLSILILAAVLIVVKLIRLIYTKQYKLALAIILGLPIALIIGYASLIGLLATSGI